jgi:hypothetical protein
MTQKNNGFFFELPLKDTTTTTTFTYFVEVKYNRGFFTFHCLV